MTVVVVADIFVADADDDILKIHEQAELSLEDDDSQGGRKAEALLVLGVPWRGVARYGVQNADAATDLWSMARRQLS